MSVDATRVLSGFAFCVLAVVATAGCSKQTLTQGEKREQRVRERLELSFSEEQVDCMMKQFDSQLIHALDRETGMPEGQMMTDFTDVARACVLSEGTVTTTTTTAITASTTTGPSDEPGAETSTTETSSPESRPATTGPTSSTPASDDSTEDAPTTTSQG